MPRHTVKEPRSVPRLTSLHEYVAIHPLRISYVRGTHISRTNRSYPPSSGFSGTAQHINASFLGTGNDGAVAYATEPVVRPTRQVPHVPLRHPNSGANPRDSASSSSEPLSGVHLA